MAPPPINAINNGSRSKRPATKLLNGRVKQKLKKLITDSDYKNVIEELPPPEDLVFMDVAYSTTRNLRSRTNQNLVHYGIESERRKRFTSYQSELNLEKEKLVNMHTIGIVQRMPLKKKINKPEVNQQFEKILTYSDSENDMEELEKEATDNDSESDMEEVRPPPDDLVFMDDVYPATRNLDKADKEKLVFMHRIGQNVWTCPKRRYGVKPKECHKLVSNGATLDIVMGCWMSILEEKYRANPNVPSCYLPNIFFRAFVTMGSKTALKELDRMKGHRLICIPVCTPTSRKHKNEELEHWTLLVLDVKERKWTHFNTLPGTGRDWNYRHSTKLMDWVDEKMGEYLDQVSPIVGAKKSRRENYEATPKQPKESLDCGICVLMILEQLMEGKTKDQLKNLFSFTKDEVAKYRTLMVQTFLRLGKEQERRSSDGQAKSNAKLADESYEEDEDEHSETLCGSCGGNYNADEFWIGCDICERWYHGKCVKITPAKAENIKQYKCPACMKRARQ